MARAIRLACQFVWRGVVQVDEVRTKPLDPPPADDRSDEDGDSDSDESMGDGEGDASMENVEGLNPDGVYSVCHLCVFVFDATNHLSSN